MELRKAPEPYREARDSSDILPAHLDNMEACAINTARYRALLEALEKREALQDR